MHRKRYSATALALIALLAIAGAAFAGRLGGARAQEHITIPVGDIWFCDPSNKNGECVTDIYVDDTVTWDFSAAKLPHSATACGDSCDSPTLSPLWDSDVIMDGRTYSYTFTQAGDYPYRCVVHSFQRGRIFVHEGARPATPTLVVISPPVDYLGTETPTPTTVVEELPHSGQGSSGGASDWPALAALVSGGVALLCAGGAFALRGRTLRKR